MKRGVIISILLHLILAGLLFLGFSQFLKSPPSSNPELQIIESYTVDASSIERKPEIKPKDKDRLEVEETRKANKARQKKQQALALEKKKRLKQKKRKEQERQRQAKIKKAKEEKARRAKIAKEKKLAAARRKAQLQAGQARERAKTNSIINKYSRLIKQKMQRNWRRPADSRSLACTTKIKLLPDGSVLDVKIIKPSGSSAFDGSVIDALYRAGALPLPPEPKYRKLFVDDDLTMKFTNQR